MGNAFLNKIKGFFSSGTKKDSLATNLDYLPELLQKNFFSEKKILEELSGKRISEIKFLHSKTVNLVKRVSEKELEAKSNERLNRAALTSKNQFVQSSLKLLEKINPKGRAENADDARHYFGESYSMLVAEVFSFKKNIAYTSFYLKEEMKELGETLQEMLNIFQAMNKEFALHADLFEFENIKKKISVLKLNKNSLEKIREEKKMIEQKIAAMEKRLVEKKEGLEKKKSGKELVQLRELESALNELMVSKQELKTEISALILNVDRPLQRFNQLVESGRWVLPSKEKEILGLFLTNPVLALKSDPKAELFKKVLAEVIKAIEDNSVELKEKEKEKRLEALQEIINFDFFGKVFWRMNELQRKQDELNKEISKSDAKKELEKMITEIGAGEKEILGEKELLLESDRKLGAAQIELEREIAVVKNFAEKSLNKLIVLEED